VRASRRSPTRMGEFRRHGSPRAIFVGACWPC
jgi:hypothetical protein